MSDYYKSKGNDKIKKKKNSQLRHNYNYAVMWERRKKFLKQNSLKRFINQLQILAYLIFKKEKISKIILN